MAKSIRAKGKMAARRKKRETGFYAATEAARLERLSAKLLGKGKGKEDGQADGGAHPHPEAEKGDVAVEDAQMEEVEAQPRKISTSAPRETRREQWRLSKGMTARPKGKGLNRQGMAGARSKAGRPKRRR